MRQCLSEEFSKLISSPAAGVRGIPRVSDGVYGADRSEGRSATAASPLLVVAQLLSGVRSALGLSVPVIAAELGTSQAVVRALESASLESLPVQPEAHRIVDAWLRLAGLDPRPALTSLDQAYALAAGRPSPSSAPSKAAPGSLLRRVDDPAAVSAHTVSGTTGGGVFAQVRDGAHHVAVGKAKHGRQLSRAEKRLVQANRREVAQASQSCDEPAPRRLVSAFRRFIPRRPALFSLSLGLPPSWPARTGALLLILAVLATTAYQTQVVAGAMAQLPAPADRAFRSLSDFIAIRFAPVREGHRWIDVADPRSRRGDKLRIGQHSD